MGFANGSVTFTLCRLPRELPEEYIDMFVDNAGKELTHVKEKPQMGWVTAYHLLDTNLTEERCEWAGYIHMQLRVAVRKIPSSLLDAECKIEELAHQKAFPERQVTSKIRRDIKDQVAARLIAQMPPSLNGIPFVYKPGSLELYVGTATQTQLELFCNFFSKTTGLQPEPMTMEDYLMNEHGIAGEKAPRFNFSQYLDDFYATQGTIGQNFLTWLFYNCELYGEEQCMEVPGDNTPIFLQLDGPLMFVAEGKDGQESVIRKGAPMQSPESQAALNAGKNLKQAKLYLSNGEDTWRATVDADLFAFRSMKLPEGEKLDEASYFEERQMFLEQFCDKMLNLMNFYASKIADAAARKDEQRHIKEWVNERGRFIMKEGAIAAQQK